MVGRYVVAEPEKFAFKNFIGHHDTFLGSVISPVNAEAAAVAGLARYIEASGLPMRPLKLRLAVDRQTSLSPRTPWCKPRHAAHPGGSIIAPALTKIWM